MRVGASTFIWVSPFSNRTLDLIDRVKAFGFDLILLCASKIRKRSMSRLLVRAPGR